MDTVNPDPKHIPDDELQLQNYQDDLDTRSSLRDPVLDHETDDPTKELGVDVGEFKRELEQFDDETGSEDGRETIEDLNEEID